MGKKQIIIDQYENEIYEGVTRFDNGNVEHGDRHDAAFAEMRRRIKNAPESAKHIPPVRDFQQEREAREWPEVRERLIKSHGEYMTNEYEDMRFNDCKEAQRKADELERVRAEQAERTPYGHPRQSYVEPKIPVDITPVLIAAFIMLGIFVALGG